MQETGTCTLAEWLKEAAYIQRNGAWQGWADELRCVVHLWTYTLADGGAAAWRSHLFSQAIPNAMQAWKPF